MQSQFSSIIFTTAYPYALQFCSCTTVCFRCISCHL